MNYYNYCETISREYYPKIYFEVREYTKKVLEKIDKDKLHPFPNCNLFEEITEKVFEKYKNENYKKFKNGEIINVDFTSRESILLLKDFIKVIIISYIISNREKYKDFPCYY